MRKRAAATAVLGVMLVAAGCMPSQAPTQAAATQAPAQSAQTEKSGEAESTAAAADGQVSIRMNWWGGDSRHEATLNGIRAFEKENPDIHVDAEYEAYNGHQEKIALAINSGVAADVLQMNMNWIFTYSPDGKTFLDLNSVSDIINLSDYDQADLDYYTINGSLQAIPISKTGRVFYWNTTTFDKVGAKIPTTLDELMEAGKKFAAYEDGSYYPLVTNEHEKTYIMLYYLECKYGKPWTKDLELQYTKEELIDGFEFMKALEDNHVLPSTEKLAGDGADLMDTNQNWIDGHYAGLYMWDSSLQKHKDAVADGNMVVGQMIDMGDYHGGVLKISQCLAVPATTQHPKEAAKLIHFLFGTEEGAKLLGDTRGVPCNATAIAALDLSDSLAAQANDVCMAWGGFMEDQVFSSSILTSTEGIFTLALQSQSYGESSAEACADMVIDGVKQAADSLK